RPVMPGDLSRGARPACERGRTGESVAGKPPTTGSNGCDGLSDTIVADATGGPEPKHSHALTCPAILISDNCKLVSNRKQTTWPGQVYSARFAAGPGPPSP